MTICITVVQIIFHYKKTMLCHVTCKCMKMSFVTNSILNPKIEQLRIWERNECSRDAREKWESSRMNRRWESAVHSKEWLQVFISIVWHDASTNIMRYIQANDASLTWVRIFKNRTEQNRVEQNSTCVLPAGPAVGLYWDWRTYLGLSSPAMISFCVIRRSGELVCNGNNATAGTPIGVNSSLHCPEVHSIVRGREKGHREMGERNRATISYDHYKLLSLLRGTPVDLFQLEMRACYRYSLTSTEWIFVKILSAILHDEILQYLKVCFWKLQLCCKLRLNIDFKFVL